MGNSSVGIEDKKMILPVDHRGEQVERGADSGAHVHVVCRQVQSEDVDRNIENPDGGGGQHKPTEDELGPAGQQGERVRREEGGAAHAHQGSHQVLEEEVLGKKTEVLELFGKEEEKSLVRLEDGEQGEQAERVAVECGGEHNARPDVRPDLAPDHHPSHINSENATLTIRGLCVQEGCDTRQTLPSLNRVGLRQREEGASVAISEVRRGVHTGRPVMMPVVHTVGGAVPARANCTVQSEILQWDKSTEI